MEKMIDNVFATKYTGLVCVQVHCFLCAKKYRMHNLPKTIYNKKEVKQNANI